MEYDKEHFHLLLYCFDSKKTVIETPIYLRNLFWVCSIS